MSARLQTKRRKLGARNRFGRLSILALKVLGLSRIGVSVRFMCRNRGAVFIQESRMIPINKWSRSFQQADHSESYWREIPP